MTAGGWITELRDHIFNLIQKAQGAKRKWREAMKSPSPPSVMSFLQQLSIAFSNSVTNSGSVFKYLSP